MIQEKERCEKLKKIAALLPIIQTTQNKFNKIIFLYEKLIKHKELSLQIEHNQIDLVIFLRDPFTPKSHEPDVNNIVHLCDRHNIPLATNLATAELLVKALDRGDMDFRDLYK